MDEWLAGIVALCRLAATLPAAERAALLDRECDDPELRRELEALLDEQASDGVITSDASIILRLQQTHTSSSGRTFLGERIGPYQVLSLLGVGGIGQVYRASDSRLGRQVAVKVLRPAFASDPRRLARFEREARLLASLNHPNIAVIHGIEDAAGRPAIVMELVEGQTLAELLSPAGDQSSSSPGDATARNRLAIEDALHLARQIADALEAAHERGIIHRDLKPSNIKITSNRIVKVLDFGLAKTMFSEAEGAPAAKLERTQTGAVIGTPAYMSPEQARGGSVDKRTDIWAFGCVLYEMLAGQRAFEGATISDTLVAVLEGEPDWRCLPAATPPAVVHLLHQCLEKDAARRRRDIADVRLELTDPVQSAITAPVAVGRAAPARSRERVAWAVAALFAVVAGVLGSRHYLAPEIAPEPVIQAIVPPPDGWVIRTAQAPMRLSISPDGTRIAFTASTAEPPVRSQLWVRRLDSLLAQPLAGTDNATGPFWSPDSRTLGFFADGKLKRIDASGGGQPLALCDVEAGVGAPLGATWNQDGVIVFATNGHLARVPAAGGTPTSVTKPGKGLIHQLPFFLPDGRHFLYRVAGGPFLMDSQIAVGSLDSDDGRLLVRNTAQAMFSQRHLLYSRDGRLLAQPFDERRFELSGQAFPVAEQVLTGGGGASAFSVSPGGVLVYQPGAVQRSLRLSWVDRAGKPTAELDQGLYGDFQLSSDGKRVAVSLARDEAGGEDIWIFERGLKTKFTSNRASESVPIWSPDDQRIIFSRARPDGGRDLILKASTNVGDEEVLLADGAENSRPAGRPTDSSCCLGAPGERPARTCGSCRSGAIESRVHSPSPRPEKPRRDFPPMGDGLRIVPGRRARPNLHRAVPRPGEENESVR